MVKDEIKKIYLLEREKLSSELRDFGFLRDFSFQQNQLIKTDKKTRHLLFYFMK